MAKRPSRRAGLRTAEPTVIHPGCELLINARAHTRRGAQRSVISADGHVKGTLDEAVELLLLFPEKISHARGSHMDRRCLFLTGLFLLLYYCTQHYGWMMTRRLCASVQMRNRALDSKMWEHHKGASRAENGTKIWKYAEGFFFSFFVIWRKIVYLCRFVNTYNNLNSINPL